MSIWKQAEGLCLIALYPQDLLQMSMQIPVSQPRREQGENLCVALGCGVSVPAGEL